jgi:hypothetical protein
MSPIEPFKSFRSAVEEISVYRFGMRPPQVGDIIERDYGLARVLRVRERRTFTEADLAIGARPDLGDFMVDLEYERLPA